jgi:hypothetical protein
MSTLHTASPDPEEKLRMIVRTLPKRDVQKMIKALRDVGLTVSKYDYKYECRSPMDDSLLFQALNGRHNYLVRMRNDLFA